MEMKIHCAQGRLVPIADLISHPKSPEESHKDQIERLARLFVEA